MSGPRSTVLWAAPAGGRAGQVEKGLRLLAEALAAFEANGRGRVIQFS
jgi:hypothetical protein